MRVTHACALPTERSCMRDCARRKTSSIRQTCSMARRTFRLIRLAPHGEVSTEKGMRNSLRSSKYFIAGLPRLPKCTRVRFGSRLCENSDVGLAPALLLGRGPFRVKLRRTHCEQMSFGLPLKDGVI